MELAEFAALHRPALEANPVRHNVILALLDQAQAMPDHNCLFWSLGEPGACAIKTPQPGRGIMLGELNEAQCAELARMTASLDYPSVAGPDDSPKWFVAAAEALGLRFRLGHAQRIHALSRPPTRPDAPGLARPAQDGRADKAATDHRHALVDGHAQALMNSARALTTPRLCSSRPMVMRKALGRP